MKVIWFLNLIVPSDGLPNKCLHTRKSFGQRLILIDNKYVMRTCKMCPALRRKKNSQLVSSLLKFPCFCSCSSFYDTLIIKSLYLKFNQVVRKHIVYLSIYIVVYLRWLSESQ